jgi:2,5-diketo-D-gluconate reductase A
VLVALAEKHGRTPAQVVLRWHVQLGNVVFPKSVHPERMRENLAVFDFALSPEDLDAVSALDVGGRMGPHPDDFN